MVPINMMPLVCLQKQLKELTWNYHNEPFTKLKIKSLGPIVQNIVNRTFSKVFYATSLFFFIIVFFFYCCFRCFLFFSGLKKKIGLFPSSKFYNIGTLDYYVY